MQSTTMPLSGVRVVVTRSADQATFLSNKLRNLGATTIEIPMIEIIPPSDTDSMDSSIRNLGKYDWVIFTSVHGVEFFLRRMAILQIPTSCLYSVRIAAIGSATSAAIQSIGRSPDYVPSRFLSESIAAGLDGLQGKRVLLPRADIASKKLPLLLRDKGASVDEVVAYRTVVPRELTRDRLKTVLETGVDVVIFTSPSTVCNFANALEHASVTKDLSNVRIACIGPVTAEAARQLGMAVDVVANPHTIDALVEAIVSDVRKKDETSSPDQATAQREFLKYTFFKVDSQWRRLDANQRRLGIEQFASLVEDFGEAHLIRSYSLVGIRGDTDFLLWNISRHLEELQSFTAALLRSEFGKYLGLPYSYLAITRKSEYLGDHEHAGQDGLASQSPGISRYLFVYPFIKKREWYFLPHEQRTIMMAQHFKIGHKYPSVRIHTGYSFGLDDQEFVLAFETNEPADFAELVMELRSSEASRYTELETPIFTCVQMRIRDILDMLG